MWTFTFDRSKEQHNPELVLPGLDNIEFSRSQDGQYRTFHSHEECHLLFCVGGKGFLRLNDTELELVPGVLGLIRPGTLHACGAQDDSLEFWGLSFYPSGLEDTLTQFFLECNLQGALFDGYLNYVKGAFALLLDLCGENGGDHSHMDEIRTQVFSLLYFARIMFQEHPLKIANPQELPMQQVMRWIMDHYTEDISLEKLARQFAMSSSHLSRSFYQSFQVSPINYLIDYRLAMAKDQLIYTDKSIREIAESIGYDNVYHFSNLFSKRIGRTPQQFREFCRKVDTQPVPVRFGAQKDGLAPSEEEEYPPTMSGNGPKETENAENDTAGEITD